MNRFDRYLIWILACVVATAAVAWIAYGLQQDGIAPAVIFPLAVGSALGAVCAAILRWTTVPTLRVAVAAAAFWGLLAVVGQDYIGHKRRVAELESKMAAEGAVGMLAAAHIDELRPGFFEHLRAIVRRQPVWWTLDLLLTSAAAAATTCVCARRWPPAALPPA